MRVVDSYEALDEVAIAKHLESYLGPCIGLMHGFFGGCHVYRFGANDSRPFQTLVTMGLSGMPPAPDGRRRAELMAYLPADWPEPSDDESAGWPYEMLRGIVDHAWNQNASVEAWQVFPNLTDEPEQAFTDDSALCATVLTPPTREGEAFDNVDIGGINVHFLVAVAITNTEYQHALADDSAMKALIAGGSVPEIIDVSRASVV